MTPNDKTPEPNSSRRDSPANVCLRKVSTRIAFEKDEIYEIEDGVMSGEVTFEIRAWVCPWCEQTTEYVLLNGNCVLGCGMSSTMANGRSSDHCDRPSCNIRSEHFIDTGEVLKPGICPPPKKP